MITKLTKRMVKLIAEGKTPKTDSLVLNVLRIDTPEFGKPSVTLRVEVRDKEKKALVVIPADGCVLCEGDTLTLEKVKKLFIIKYSYE